MSDLGLLIVSIITGMVGASSTYLLANKTNWGTVRSSAVLSLLVGIVFFKLGESNNYLREVPFLFIGASFVGMTSSSKLNLIGILFAGALFGVVYLLIPSVYAGSGGAMGTAACVSVLCVYGIATLVENSRSKKRGSSEPLD